MEDIVKELSISKLENCLFYLNEALIQLEIGIKLLKDDIDDENLCYLSHIGDDLREKDKTIKEILHFLKGRRY
jgi:hypothetical protein